MNMDKNKYVYFVDDDHMACRLFERACEKMSFQCDVFSDANSCIDRIREHTPDVVLTDLNMPGMDGFELIETINQQWPSLPVIAVTGQSSVERAVNAMRTGARDFIEKPYSLELLENSINRNIQYAELGDENITAADADYGMIGESAEMHRIYKMIDRLSSVDCSVIISGESGSGKELAARAIHTHGDRKDAPFIAIDCGSLPDSLLESELFGHLKGAFTGATKDRTGLFEAAGKGTIFLDEIGNISSAMQAKLLRVLQENIVTPVGSNRNVPIQARIICASNRDLAEMVEAGEFRHDLYHRINVITLPMPSLKTRREDIPLLISHFIQEFSDKHGLQYRTFTDSHMQTLCEQPWKGNIRELRNYVERCVILAEGDSLDDIAPPRADCPPGDRQCGDFITLKELEQQHIRKVLANVSGNQNKAAKILGISRTTLWRKLND
jgi:DNA-binding NtrC family response regulator